MNSSYQRSLKVFLCHASEDKPLVRKLYRYLRNNGIDAWLDEEDILAGQSWELEIKRAIRETHVMLVCLSNKSAGKRGYVQKEIRIGLDEAEMLPEGEIFIIPVRLEDCPMPFEKLKELHWVNLYEENGYQKLMRALQRQASSLGIPLAGGRRADQSPFPSTPSGFGTPSYTPTGEQKSKPVSPKSPTPVTYPGTSSARRKSGSFSLVPFLMVCGFCLCGVFFYQLYINADLLRAAFPGVTPFAVATRTSTVQTSLQENQDKEHYMLNGHEYSIWSDGSLMIGAQISNLTTDSTQITFLIKNLASSPARLSFFVDDIQVTDSNGTAYQLKNNPLFFDEELTVGDHYDADYSVEAVYNKMLPPEITGLDLTFPVINGQSPTIHVPLTAEGLAVDYEFDWINNYLSGKNNLSIKLDNTTPHDFYARAYDADLVVQDDLGNFYNVSSAYHKQEYPFWTRIMGGRGKEAFLQSQSRNDEFYVEAPDPRAVKLIVTTKVNNTPYTKEFALTKCIDNVRYFAQYNNGNAVNVSIVNASATDCLLRVNSGTPITVHDGDGSVYPIEIKADEPFRFLSIFVKAGETAYLNIYTPAIKQAAGAVLLINTIPEANEVISIPITPP